MGLLDRVNQANQQRSPTAGPVAAPVAPPPVAPPSNGAPGAEAAGALAPTAAAPAAPKATAPTTAAPVAGGLAERAGVTGVTPAFAAAKTAVHAKLLEQRACARAG